MPKASSSVLPGVSSSKSAVGAFSTKIFGAFKALARALTCRLDKPNKGAKSQAPSPHLV